MSQTRRLAAVLAADVAGYSRLMGAAKKARSNASKRCARDLVEPKIAEHHGSIVKTTGDGMLVEFASRYLPLHREGAILSLERMGDAAIFKLDVLGGQGSPARQSCSQTVFPPTRPLISRCLARPSSSGATAPASC